MAGEPFETKEPVEVSELFATDVGSDSATLNALVNPLGIPACGHFEYVSDAKFKEDGFTQAAKAPDVDGGRGRAGPRRRRSAQAQQPDRLPAGGRHHLPLPLLGDQRR